MATSSAKPADLFAYRDAGLAQVVAWEAEVPGLTTALSELRTALADLDLPPECTVSVPEYETSFDGYVRDQRHLDEWVGDVGLAFVLQDPALFWANPTGVMTVDNSQIRVGYPDRARSEEQAREDAEAIAAIIGEYGLVNPADIMNDPERLEELAEQYPELRDLLADSERFLHDEDYAAALVNALGPENVRTLADLTNTFGIAQDQGMIEGNAYDGYVVPLAAILATADRSGRMDDEVRDALFDMDATDEPPIEGRSDSIIEQEALDMRYRTLGLLVYAGEFSPETTAQMADAILHDSPVAPSFYDWTGFTGIDVLDEHRPLASNEWAALTALERDDQAANIFFGMTNDDGDHYNLYVMDSEGGAEVAASRLGIPVDELRPEIQTTLANTLRGGLLEHPLAAGTIYQPEQLELVSETMHVAGLDYIDTSDQVRTALAQVSTPYTRDIAFAAEGNDPDLGISRLEGLSHDELELFLQEVSESRDARTALAQNGAALVNSEMAAAGPTIATDPNAFGTGAALGTAYYRELGQAWDEVQIGWVEQREALVAGWRSWTDPVVDMVSGKIVEKIPVVNVAADLPIASTVVDGLTDQMADSINDAVYDRLIPPPEGLEAMTTWKDAIEEDVEQAVVSSLYEVRETRQDYLSRAEGHANQDPAQWAEFNADGHIDMDEFRQLAVVRDTTQSQTTNVTTALQTEMAFERIFSRPGSR